VGVGPIQLLKRIVADAGAGRRDRVQAANNLLLHKARTQRAKSKSHKLTDAELDQIGWMTHWHVGHSDGRGPDDPLYGVNLLARDRNERRCPKTGRPLPRRDVERPDWRTGLEMAPDDE
jgi:hypothetical protein